MRFPAVLSFACVSLPLLASEPAEVKLWVKGAPGSEGKQAAEVVEKGGNGERKVTGVHVPSITPYLPAKERASGAAVVILPGGGHRMLAIDHEGYQVGQWLSARGIAAFVVKYRLARETNSNYKIEEHALRDTQRAIQLVRSRAREWSIDPRRVGVMGFSAGGELAALSWMRPPKSIEGTEADEADRENARPSFQALIYPGGTKSIVVDKEAPPAFLACAFNDRPDISEGLAEVYLKLKRAGVPTELHIYSGGGHGFGLRESNRAPVGKWIERFTEWMGEQGFLGEPRSK